MQTIGQISVTIKENFSAGDFPPVTNTPDEILFGVGIFLAITTFVALIMFLAEKKVLNGVFSKTDMLSIDGLWTLLGYFLKALAVGLVIVATPIIVCQVAVAIGGCALLAGALLATSIAFLVLGVPVAIEALTNAWKDVRGLWLDFQV